AWLWQLGRLYAELTIHALQSHLVVDVDECFAQSLRMSARRSSEGQNLWRQKRIASADGAHRLSLQREPQVACFPVRPVEHALFPVDAQPDVILTARGGLRSDESAPCAAHEFKQRRDGVDDFPSGQPWTHIGGDPRDVHAGG